MGGCVTDVVLSIGITEVVVAGGSGCIVGIGVSTKLSVVVE